MARQPVSGCSSFSPRCSTAMAVVSALIDMWSKYFDKQSYPFTAIFIHKCNSDKQLLHANANAVLNRLCMRVGGGGGCLVGGAFVMCVLNNFCQCNVSFLINCFIFMWMTIARMIDSSCQPQQQPVMATTNHPHRKCVAHTNKFLPTILHNFTQFNVSACASVDFPLNIWYMLSSIHILQHINIICVWPWPAP